jgi:hypothetical protein
MRYSDRTKLVQHGTLGDVVHDRVSDEMATAIRALMESAQSLVREMFYERLTNAAIQHFGVGQPWHGYVSGGMSPDVLLDFIEIASDQAQATIAAPDQLPASLGIR